MEDVVIIKLFKTDYMGDFHDLYACGHIVGDANADVAELKAYGKKTGKTILFTACPVLDVADFDNIAEISYSGILSDEEKQFYVDIIKRFSRDDGINCCGEYEVCSVPVTIIFKQCGVADIIKA